MNTNTAAAFIADTANVTPAQAETLLSTFWNTNRHGGIMVSEVRRMAEVMGTSREQTRAAMVAAFTWYREHAA